MNHNILNLILGNIWALHEREISAQKIGLVSLLKQNISMSDAKELRSDLEAKTKTHFAIKSESDGFMIADVSGNSAIPKGAIAIMRMSGVIQKESGLCSKGLDDYESELDYFGQNGNVKGIVLEMHSPGGTAIGWDTFGQAVAGFETKYNKPIAVVIKSMAASAAYGITAQAPMIFVSSETAEAGSIGTMATLYNEVEFMKANGLEEIVVRATKSINKNEPYYQALQGNTDPLKKEILDPLNEKFIESIKKARRGKLDLKTTVNIGGQKVPEIFTGTVYFGSQIVEKGLADAMGGRDEAIRYIDSKSKELKKRLNKQQTKQQMLKLKNKSVQELQSMKTANEEKIQAGLEGEALENAEFEVEMIDIALNSALASEKIAELENKVSSDSELQSKIEALEAENSELKTKIESGEKNAEKIQALESELQSAKSEKEAAELAATEKEKELASTKEANEKMNSFLQKEFGEEVTAGIIQGKSTETGQPEGLKKKKILSKEEEMLQIRKMTESRFAEK